MTNILPLPVKKNKFGQRVADISVNDYYRQIMEEVLEAHEAAVNVTCIAAIKREGCGLCVDYIGSHNEAEELADIIATCITRLDILGYDEDARQKLYQAVNDKNKSRGYFED